MKKAASVTSSVFPQGNTTWRRVEEFLQTLSLTQLLIYCSSYTVYRISSSSCCNFPWWGEGKCIHTFLRPHSNSLGCPPGCPLWLFLASPKYFFVRGGLLSLSPLPLLLSLSGKYWENFGKLSLSQLLFKRQLQHYF